MRFDTLSHRVIGRLNHLRMILNEVFNDPISNRTMAR
jgi:hypothetical protein